MRRRKRINKLSSDMNIVPYVDVMFVLLTIFMVTATTISVGIDVDPPQMESSQAVAVEGEEMMVISVDATGSFFFNLADNPNIALPEGEIEVLARNIFAENNNIQALVKGDKNAPYGRIIDAMGLLQGVTQKNVQLMTAPTE
ncbi:biopolymer transporter ExbD [Ignatzschineria cameli]|uniref:Biopolymer transporter ExbD n=1 Tax=Ignatzschineria cameli TaxID=2182793 RepID=A0A2U2AR29_9GAMM|nr:biopolymer transporter ExbD [Ignatzschineria cameli]PWD85240.1 biopolymer transporter ExbD [Ignatzschineria cameli]PWD86335.1 biopolymer transporter ExbD [Ignatzschineria cameli]PWD89827.1 biopolymer transporter ExbD [Ignatzschineria cameli]PWD91477.1 biopolymer transporter ExbD [Ignatzschineria cameli]PWD92515.1 biopolymer transporter ExbD [Ignatzschineria cameli]